VSATLKRPTTVSLVEAKALVLIGALQAKYGQPPLWSEIGRTLRLRRSELENMMWKLRHLGFVTFTTEPRSLRLRPGAAEIALRSLKEAA
jgi:DNA-binding IclR family transcriptional regulator